MTQPPVTVDVVSDVMCPWCYIGKRRLEKARAMHPHIPVDVIWRPFQLDPTIPDHGMDRRTYLERKFGSSTNVERIYAPVVAAGGAEDIPFAFDSIHRTPNTFDAHRLIGWAKTVGLQDEMVERLFHLYFVEGGDLCDKAVLAGAAAAIGMERPVVERLLASEADVALVRREIDAARRIGITGVPTFIIDSHYAVVGAQDPAIIAGAIAKAHAERVASH